jgi:thiol-disulfide isomerase/thioredoxin
MLLLVSGAEGRLRVGDKAPALVSRLIGETRYFLLSDHVGETAREPKKAMVVSFFATWCDPCKKELPELQKLLQELECQQLGAVLVSYGESEDMCDNRMLCLIPEYTDEMHITSAEPPIQGRYGMTSAKTRYKGGAA